MISDLLQKDDFEHLFNECGTSNLELAKSTANIFSMFDPSNVWKFLDYVAKLPSDRRKEKRGSTLVACLTIGRIGETNTRRAIQVLRVLLSDDHMLRSPVEASLSNLWVFDKRSTEKHLFDSWIAKGLDNDDLQEIAVLSCDYVLSRDPEHIEPFLKRVLRIKDPRARSASNAAKQLITKYNLAKKMSKTRKKPKR